MPHQKLVRIHSQPAAPALLRRPAHSIGIKVPSLKLNSRVTPSMEAMRSWNAVNTRRTYGQFEEKWRPRRGASHFSKDLILLIADFRGNIWSGP